MQQAVKVGIIGDYNPHYQTHHATNAALSHAAETLSVALEAVWLPTLALAETGSEITLQQFDALWCAPGSPYNSMAGALQAIRFARERGRPFIGTCGGFQHAVLEYARNVLGIVDAEHAETAPHAPRLLIHKLACSLVGQTQTIMIRPDSLAYQSYGQAEVREQFFCSFGLNPAYRDQFNHGAFRITGVDASGEARILELTDHPFFIATLFVPQVRSTIEQPHPLIVAYVKAARGFQSSSREHPARLKPLA